MSTFKQVKLVFGKRGICKILAHGTVGIGTVVFTLKLAQDLGTIVERHQGTWHTHTTESTDVHEKAYVHESMNT